MINRYTLDLQQCFLPVERLRQCNSLPIALVWHGQSAPWIRTHCLIAHTESKTVFPYILNDTGRTNLHSVGLCEVPLQRQMENMGISVSCLHLSSPAWQATVPGIIQHPLRGDADALTAFGGWHRAMLTWISSQRGPVQREQEGRRQTSTIMCQTISSGWPSGQDLSEMRWRPVQLHQSTLCRPYSADCSHTASSGERRCTDVWLTDAGLFLV